MTPERLIRRTHHLAERRACRHRIIQILKDHNRRPGQLSERRRLFDQTTVSLSRARRRRGTESRSAGVTDHRRQLGIARLYRRIHETGGARIEVVQFDDIADRWRVVFTQQC